VKEQTLSRIFA